MTEHVNYPHTPGYLYDCPACEESCHCSPDSAECVWPGHDGVLRDRWAPGETARFTYGLPWDGGSEICADLYHRTGQVVTILTLHENDGGEFPTAAERGDAGVPFSYDVQFPDGFTYGAFEDELESLA